MKKKLHKSNKNRMIGGVCSGIAEYFDIDPTIVRIAAVILTLIKGIGLIVYIIGWIAMPKADTVEAQYSDDDIEHMKKADTCNEDKRENENSSDSKKNAAHSDSDFDEYFKK